METGSVYTYIGLILAGLLLVGTEIFVPGGVLGIVGLLAFIGAAGMGFRVFPPPYGMVSAMAIVVGAGVGLVLWIQLFPKTVMGRKLMLTRDGRDNKSAPAEYQALLGQVGTAQSTLRPSGIALVAGTRRDVIADGQWIDAGAAIQVVAVKGARILVRALPGAQAGNPAS